MFQCFNYHISYFTDAELHPIHGGEDTPGPHHPAGARRQGGRWAFLFFPKICCLFFFSLIFFSFFFQKLFFFSKNWLFFFFYSNYLCSFFILFIANYLLLFIYLCWFIYFIFGPKIGCWLVVLWLPTGSDAKNITFSAWN